MMSELCVKTEERVTAEQMRGEVAAMLKVCFEGSVGEVGDVLRLVLPEGQSFDISVRES